MRRLCTSPGTPFRQVYPGAGGAPGAISDDSHANKDAPNGAKNVPRHNACPGVAFTRQRPYTASSRASARDQDSPRRHPPKNIRRAEGAPERAASLVHAWVVTPSRQVPAPATAPARTDCVSMTPTTRSARRCQRIGVRRGEDGAPQRMHARGVAFPRHRLNALLLGRQPPDHGCEHHRRRHQVGRAGRVDARLPPLRDGALLLAHRRPRERHANRQPVSEPQDFPMGVHKYFTDQKLLLFLRKNSFKSVLK
jgi:hypothetical protein